MGLGELTISPLDPHDVFLDPAGQRLEPVAHGWGVFEFNELRGVYSTRELAEEMIEMCQARWRQLPPSVLPPDWYPDRAFTIREVPILDRQPPDERVVARTVWRPAPARPGCTQLQGRPAPSDVDEEHGSPNV